MKPAVFLDRDGVINQLVRDPISGLPESPLDPAQVALLPRVAPALRRLRDADFVIVGVSNQPAAAKGIVELGQLESVQARVLELLEHDGTAPDDFRSCFHHPHGLVPELTCECTCRKPSPGMLLQAAEQLELDLGTSWMLGDTDSDVAAGIAAGCRTILIENPDSSHKRSGDARPDAVASDLAAGVEVIISERALT